MAIEKFKNEIGTDLNAYKLVREDGTSENIKLLRNANITQQGTPLNEATLNPIVEAINNNTTDVSGKVDKQNITEEDLNNIIVSGFYRLSENNANMPSGCGLGQLLVIQGGGDTIAQLCFPYQSSDIYIRNGNPIKSDGGITVENWHEWKQLANITQVNVKVDKEDNKYLLTQKLLTSTDLNTIINSGIYGVNSSCSNKPTSNGGALIVTNYNVEDVPGGLYPQQIFKTASDENAEELYMRGVLNFQNNSWSPWIRVDTTPSLYNMGAFDTIAFNDDNTVTITRQTGYFKIDSSYPQSKINVIVNDDGTTTYDFYNPIMCDYMYYNSYNDTNTTSTIKGNLKRYATNGASVNSWGYQYAYTLRIICPQTTGTTINDLMNYLKTHPVYLDYKRKTSYKETIILNQPIMNLDKQGCQWVKDQYENNINLFNFSQVWNNNGVTKAVSGSVVILNGTTTGTEHQGDLGNMTLDVGTYTISNTLLKNNGDTMRLVIHPSNWSWQTTLLLGDVSSYQTFNITTKQNVVFSIYQDSDRSYDNLTLGVMLTKGLSICPYTPFNDKNKFIDNEFKKTLNLHPYSNGTVNLNAGGDTDIQRTITLDAGVYTLSINATSGNAFVAKDSSTWAALLNGSLGSSQYFILTKTTELYLYIQSTESVNNVPFTIMLTKGINDYDYQQTYGQIMHEQEVVKSYGENNCDDGWTLKSTINSAEISFEENDIILKTKNNTTSVDEILSRLADMGFSEGDVYITTSTSNLNTYSLENGAWEHHLKKQGNYCLCDFNINITFNGKGHATFRLPSGFRPKTRTTVVTAVNSNVSIITQAMSVTLNVDGTFTLEVTQAGNYLVYFENCGWVCGNN